MIVQGIADPVSNAVGEGRGPGKFSKEKPDSHPVAFSARLPSSISRSQLPDPQNMHGAMAAPDADG